MAETPQDDKVGTCRKSRHKCDLEEKIGYVPLALTGAGKIDEEIGGNLEKVIADLYDDVWKEGALTRKEKHLIALAVALAERQEGQTHKVLEKAKRAGASDAEIYETLKLVLWLRGVPCFVQGERMLAGMIGR
ncbi:MAG TPA: carboxymuconolactone decarboxylase family protein [Methanomassiliicoccales archaeon]|jgi:alkylhydroperoxidase/carboxymuconolactone decarboxylase family protein YurZ